VLLVALTGSTLRHITSINAMPLPRTRRAACLDDGDVPALVSFIHLDLALTPEVLHKLSQGEPASGVHVNMVAVSDKLIVHVPGSNPA
jgi:hypothetical protein